MSSISLEEIALQLEEFSFFIKFRNHPKYLHYLNQIARCVREKHYDSEQAILRKGDQCDSIFFILDGTIMIQSEYKVSRPISTSTSSTQILKNTNISTITQQIAKSRYQILNKVRLASKYDVLNEENALLSRLQPKDNAICQTNCRVLELNFSDFQRIFSSQVNEIRHRMSLFSKFFNFEEIDQSSVLSFCQACTERLHVCGDKIYASSEKTQGFFFVKSGTIEITGEVCVGNPIKSSQVIVDLVSSTEFFGLEEIHNQNFNRNYDAFVQSEKAKVLFIPISYFDPDRSFLQQDIGKMDIYKILMKISKEKSKRYQQHLEKQREQLNQQCLAQKMTQREKSVSQRVSIQEILNTEVKVNQKYRNSFTETSAPNYNASIAADVLNNPSFPYVLPPKPNCQNQNKSMNSSAAAKASQSSSQISTVLKLKMRNTSQSSFRASKSFLNAETSEPKRSRADSMILNQATEGDLQSQTFYQNMMTNDGELNIGGGSECLPIHSSRQQNYAGIVQTASLNMNYKVLFKKYLENKQNKSSTQYPSFLNTQNQNKEKQLQIQNEMDQKIPLPKYCDEKQLPSFMISTNNNNIKSLTKNHIEKQELDYGGTIFNNLMVCNSMRNPFSDQTNNDALNDTQKFFEKQTTYRVNGKSRITMTSFKSNKSLKLKENFNPRCSMLSNNEQEEEIIVLEENINSANDYQVNLHTSEENSPLKKKYNFNQKENKAGFRKTVNGKLYSFSDNKNRGSLLDTSINMNDNPQGSQGNKKLIVLQKPKRRSITPLKQAQIHSQPLNYLKQQQMSFGADTQKPNKSKMTDSSVVVAKSTEKDKQQEDSFIGDSELTEISSESSSGFGESSQIMSYQ